MTKKRKVIYNDTTDTSYRLRQRASKNGQAGSIMGRYRR